MSRNGFISDNLYDMRERLKRNHEEHNPATAAAAAPETSPVVQTDAGENDIQLDAAVQEKPVAEKKGFSKLPQLSFSNDNSDAAREGRDLEGRLLRDHSFAEAELENVQRDRISLENFRDAMEHLLQELRALDSNTLSGEEYSRRIDRLRLEYFRLYGKLESFRSGSGTGSSSGNSGNIEIRHPSQWGIISGLIAAAAIVSLTLLFIFG